jgi:hypothetical protein
MVRTLADATGNEESYSKRFIADEFVDEESYSKRFIVDEFVDEEIHNEPHSDYVLNFLGTFILVSTCAICLIVPNESDFE